jgi:hypothetical protein
MLAAQEEAEAKSATVALEMEHVKEDAVHQQEVFEHKLRAAALLAFYSLILLVEGLNRYVAKS